MLGGRSTRRFAAHQPVGVLPEAYHPLRDQQHIMQPVVIRDSSER